MLRNLTAALLVFAALVIQAGFVNRLSPRIAPDLVLLVVLSLAALRGPLPGAVIGFCGGLAYDLLPPADHPLGQYALVMCALGWLAGRLGDQLPLLAVMSCAVVAPGLAAGLGALLGDPGVSWAVLRAAWPPIALCNLLAAPVVLWAVSAPHRRRRPGETESMRGWRRGMA
ncbi:rod shape-determining protein MreD [Planotetraspora sp. A-T 1434]|uniref:rod shape-determining protein MreD n=1 Tax=Planotetraspora sp. A-T 1434 TaxID=2979219 RepID=UPI0021C06C72|nr:rod shape-determining protein MreD [Planotetraspora sp. A-T 1434]MCT9930996.1 rod shape-determining protein MreD [Planotetraspora sp. A-T 1434]